MRNRLRTPNRYAVSGINCISPTAPFLETTYGPAGLYVDDGGYELVRNSVPACIVARLLHFDASKSQCLRNGRAFRAGQAHAEGQQQHPGFITPPEPRRSDSRLLSWRCEREKRTRPAASAA